VQRIVEPELMTEADQARAYAQANFESAHSRYPLLFREQFPDCPPAGHALDLGCGPGDVTRRFARALPGWRFDAVDGAPAMLAEARRWPSERIHYIQGRIPGAPIPRARYDLVLSSSLLHHLHDPLVLWQTIRQRAAGMVFVVDLRRPATEEQARRLADQHARAEPEVLRRDFYNSLRAAFTVEEVEQQLREAGLTGLRVSEISDRHLMVAGFQNAPSRL
jgi:SAM-dependent methyltransferase